MSYMKRHFEDVSVEMGFRGEIQIQTNLDFAMQLYARGFSLLPVSSRSKRPCVKWKALQTERCTEDNVISWFGDNNYRVGIIAGELSGVVVVDADNAEAEAAVEELCPATSMTRRTKRGKHYFFAHPQDVRIPNAVNLMGYKLDVRGDGGFVVAENNLEGLIDSECLPVYDPSWLGQMYQGFITSPLI
tara:strand:+ start:897 stop:1460 length:564 start_codon:yes stop_codon:yes gene_type:complete